MLYCNGSLIMLQISHYINSTLIDFVDLKHVMNYYSYNIHCVLNLI